MKLCLLRGHLDEVSRKLSVRRSAPCKQEDNVHHDHPAGHSSSLTAKELGVFIPKYIKLDFTSKKHDRAYGVSTPGMTN